MRSPLSPTAVRAAAVLGILGPVAYVAAWAVAGATIEGYSPARDAISELAAQGSPAAAAMGAGFILFGLAALPFAAAVRQVLPDRVDARVAGPADAQPGRRRVPPSGAHGRALAIAIVVTGVATAGAAVFPCSAGCPGPGSSATDNGHAVAATLGYVALMACPLLAARQTWTVEGWRAYARVSALIGVAGTVGLVVWAAGLAGPGGGGALQRAFNTIADLWWVVTAIVVFRRADVAAQTRA